MPSIIPVVDLLDGQVVHAVGGNRTAYIPIQSRLVSSSSPVEIAQAMSRACDAEQIYVADIGAYLGKLRDWKTIAELTSWCRKSKTRLMVDLAIEDVATAMDALDRLVHFDPSPTSGPRLILALESFQNLRELPEIVDAHPHRTLFSLDLYQGEIRAADMTIADMAPEAIVAFVLRCRMSAIIVLDTADVGTRQGCSTAGILRPLQRATWPVLRPVEWIGGGGVRDRADVMALQAAGCNGVLVSTALHNQSLTRFE